MLAALNDVAMQADGRFLSDQELQGLQTYIHSFQARRAAYQFLSQRGHALVVAALQQLATTHCQDVQTQRAKCQRDMAYALKQIAKAVLLDDSEVFKQEFSLWMENITRAVHQGDSAARAYTCLKAEITQAMPAACATLVVPYVDNLIHSFSGQ